MELLIENIGLVNRAQIKLDGLTVIAGENDTGKSTVGKAIFSIIKGMNSHHRDFKEDKFSQIDDVIDNIYFKVRDISNKSNHRESTEFSRTLYPPEIRRVLLKYFNVEDYEMISNYLVSYKESIHLELDKLEASEESRTEVHLLQDKLDSLLQNAQDRDNYIYRSIRLALKSEFGSDLSNKFTEEHSKIVYYENGERIFDGNVVDGIIKSASFSLTPLEIEDVTYIESPLILQMYKMVASSNIFINASKLNRIKRNNKGPIPFHMKDLISKMSNSTYYEVEFEDSNLKIIEEISSIIGGETIFDKDSDEFIFEKGINGKQYSFNTSNVASGIKSFSMIQMLLKSQSINPRSILILDEPEIHLHPKWQIRYCEILVKLAERGIKVLVNSHSPYIIQALKVLSEKYEIEEKTNFYLAEKNENGSSLISNVNEDLNSVFKKLSDPLQSLVWE
ncbi:AAA family ATPase [Planococcus shixiaomingii]|uniref:AAA family ATPase n=1 Tax=Planococcus shixiaomingii TaxID=3058393 RepID=UPI00260E5C77|nr:AAA family ATPase [Planococcus sp. N022]WKA55515.1 AAA family ATPase [Planococcus sp. N022]